MTFRADGLPHIYRPLVRAVAAGSGAATVREGDTDCSQKKKKHSLIDDE